MPGSTDNFAIPYPCNGETIDCGVFADWANAIQAAVSTVRTAQQFALNKPAAGITVPTSNAIAVGVATVVTGFTNENYDNNGMANLGVSNDRLTIQTQGLYLVEAGLTGDGPTTTFTSDAVGILQSGTLRFREKSGINPGNTLQVVGVLDCIVGDFIQLNYLWTGTGGPQTTSGYLQARLLART